MQASAAAGIRAEGSLHMPQASAPLDWEGKPSDSDMEQYQSIGEISMQVKELRKTIKKGTVFI